MAIYRYGVGTVRCIATRRMKGVAQMAGFDLDEANADGNKQVQEVQTIVPSTYCGMYVPRPVLRYRN